MITNKTLQCSQEFMATVKDGYNRNRINLGLKAGNQEKETEPLARLQRVADFSEAMAKNVFDLVSNIESENHRNYLIKFIFKLRDGTIDQTGIRLNFTLIHQSYRGLQHNHALWLRDHLLATLLEHELFEKLNIWEEEIEKDSVPSQTEVPTIAGQDSNPSPHGGRSSESTLTPRAQQILENPASVRGTELRVMMNLFPSIRSAVRQIIDQRPWTKIQQEVLNSFFSDASIDNLPTVNSFTNGKPGQSGTLIAKYNLVTALIVDRMLDPSAPIPLPSQHSFSLEVDQNQVLEMLTKATWRSQTPSLRVILRWVPKWNTLAKEFIEQINVIKTNDENFRTREIFRSYFGLDDKPPQDNYFEGTQELTSGRVRGYVDQAIPKFADFVTARVP